MKRPAEKNSGYYIMRGKRKTTKKPHVNLTKKSLQALNSFVLCTLTFVRSFLPKLNFTRRRNKMPAIISFTTEPRPPIFT